MSQTRRIVVGGNDEVFPAGELFDKLTTNRTSATANDEDNSHGKIAIVNGYPRNSTDSINKISLSLCRAATAIRLLVNYISMCAIGDFCLNLKSTR